MSDSLTDLGERLLILEGYTNVCFALRVLKGGLKTVVDICTKFTGIYRPLFSHLFSWFRHKDSNLRIIAC